ARDSVAAAHRARACRAGTARQDDSMTSLHQELLDFPDCFGRVEILRARLGAIHDGVAAIQPERILKRVESLTGGLVAAIDDPAIRSQQCRRTQVPIAVPPVAR